MRRVVRELVAGLRMGVRLAMGLPLEQEFERKN